MPTFDDLLHEDRVFPPPTEFAREAVAADAGVYARAAADPVGYWREAAKGIDWFEDPTETLEWKPPHAKWFLGGKLNMSHNCLDRHLAGPRRHKAAIIWEGEDGAVRTLTYGQLHAEVCRFSNAMKKLGIGAGDRVAIYMPLVVEAIVAMLACTRIGAVHSVVFGGFSAESLADRINDSQCRLLITADGGWRRGRMVALKDEADKALEKCASVLHVIVVMRHPGGPFTCQIKEGRDHWYHRVMKDASPVFAPVPRDAEDLLYILYTSGTTGKPKGIVHTTGGYSVHTHETMRTVFDLKESDLFWCTADIGWVTGHSYVVYGPLQCGATILVYEGAPDFPAPDRFWRMIAEHRVTVFYTAPTAIRTFMRWGIEHPHRHDLSSLRLLGSVGEPINPEAWIWYHEHIGGNRCPIVDTWWQTETGGIMISGLPGLTSMKPGHAGTPLPGIDAVILDESGNEIPEGSGILAIRKPWPGMLRTLYGDDERYVRTYFSKWDKGTYFPGDGAKKDARGNIMILGRIDDVLNVSGHRIGTMEVESALVDHPAVAEAAVVGRGHDIKGQALVAFVSLRAGHKGSEDLAGVLRQHVAGKIGALARPDDVFFTADLPKTRSGKIMRRLLRDIAEGRALGDTTTLADPNVVAGLRAQYEENEGA